MVNVDVFVSSHLEEELAWAADKRLWVISTRQMLKASWGREPDRGYIHLSIMYNQCVYCKAI